MMSATPVASAADEWRYAVQRGDNPWSLTERYLDGLRFWPRIQALNGITDPLHIKPGTRLRIPVAWLRRVDAEARVESVNGSATVEVPAGGQQTARTGMQLVSGTLVKTAADSNLTLKFGDASSVLVHADSQVVLERLGHYENTNYFETRLRLRSGRLENLVTPHRDSPGRFEIRTPAAVTSVRGTRFRVSADASAMRSEVVEGEVDVANDLAAVQLAAGFGTVTRADSAPEAPKQLLPAPDLGALPSRLERLPIVFDIPPLDGARAYRFQLADAGGFVSPIVDGRTEGPRLRDGSPPDGRYTLRVRGIDGDGLEGIDADHAFELDARPVPPLLSEPTPQASLAEARPAFLWAVRDGIARYRLQLARDAEFTELVVDDDAVHGGNFTPAEDLAPGAYHWRVAAVDGAEGQGPFSDVQAFRRLPEPPAMDQPALGESDLTITWRAGLPGQQYNCQLAGDESFSAPIVDETVSAPSLGMARPAAGTYFVRVRTIDGDGYESPWGEPQRIEVPSEEKPWWMLVLLPLLLGLAL